MKLAVVVPRYGARGGAENALRMTAEQLVARLGWDVELHVTTATSSATWAGETEAGTTTINGVTVHHHAVTSGRTAEWAELNELVKATPRSIDPAISNQFFIEQGPVSHDLSDAVAATDADLIVFAPYLFWTTINVAPSVLDRALVVPAAHDEPFVRLQQVGRIVSRCRGLLYGCAAERSLLESLHPVSHVPNTVLGWGIDAEPLTRDTSAASRLGLDDRPYVLCVGRIEHAKGTVVLSRFWRAFVEAHSPEHRLVLLGERNADIVENDDIRIIEGADDATKWSLLRGADVMVTPSAMESFSLVVFEAWAAGTPVLVNKHCGATFDHASQSRGGLWYGDYPEFAAAMSRLLSDRDLRDHLASNGTRFGSEQYSWDSVVARFAGLVSRVLG